MIKAGPTACAMRAEPLALDLLSLHYFAGDQAFGNGAWSAVPDVDALASRNAEVRNVVCYIPIGNDIKRGPLALQPEVMTATSSVAEFRQARLLY